MKYTVLSSVTSQSNEAGQTCIQATTIKAIKGMLTDRGRREKGWEETSEKGYIWGVLKDSYEFASLINLKRDISKEKSICKVMKEHIMFIMVQDT